MADHKDDDDVPAPLAIGPGARPHWGTLQRRLTGLPVRNTNPTSCDPRFEDQAMLNRAPAPGRPLVFLPCGCGRGVPTPAPKGRMSNPFLCGSVRR